MAKRRAKEYVIQDDQLLTGLRTLVAVAACWGRRDREVSKSDAQQTRLLGEALDALEALAAAQREIAKTVVRTMFVEAVTQALRQKESGGKAWFEATGKPATAPKGKGAARAGEARPTHTPVEWERFRSWLPHEDPIIEALRCGSAAYTSLALGATEVLSVERAKVLAEAAEGLRSARAREGSSKPRRTTVAVALVNDALGIGPPLDDILGRQPEYRHAALNTPSNAHLDAVKRRHPTSPGTDGATNDAAFFGARGLPTGDWERGAAGQVLATLSGSDARIAALVAAADDDWPGKWSIATLGHVAPDAAERARMSFLTAAAAEQYGAERASASAATAVRATLTIPGQLVGDLP